MKTVKPVLLILGLLLSMKIYAAPKISFFVELPASGIDSLFSDSTLIQQLVEMKSSLRIGIMDFSPERIAVIKKLNRAGVPVTAWLLLPINEGYWFNMNNGVKATQRYHEFKQWTRSNDLRWAGIGIDIEPDFNEIRLMMKHPFRVAANMYLQLYRNEPMRKGKEIYGQLVREMEADGYRVESYIIPMIDDEREAGTTSFQKLTGLLDIETPVTIPMAYTSATGNPAIIQVYHHPGMPLGLGSTGGGVVIEGMSAPVISWDNLERDLLISNRLTSEVVIFSLEGAWEKGWLSKIASIDYSQPVPDIHEKVEAFDDTRKIFRSIFLALDHPLSFTITLAIVINAILYLVAIIILGLVRLIVK